MQPLYNSCWGRKNGTDVVENSMAVPPSQIKNTITSSRYVMYKVMTIVNTAGWYI